MNEHSEILKGFSKIIESGDYTPLEAFNMQMYAGIHGPTGSRDALKRVVEKEIAAQEYVEKKSKIHIHRWPDGTHWYADIAGEDVVDENGNVKWNTYTEAMQAAENYLNKDY